MLNQTGIKTEKATTPKSILWAPEHAISFSCVVGKASKLIMAGTPLTGDLTNRNTNFTEATTSSNSNAIGLLLHDVDTTSAKQNGTILVAGVVDMNKLDSSVASLITKDVKSALPNIIFVK